MCLCPQRVSLKDQELILTRIFALLLSVLATAGMCSAQTADASLYQTVASLDTRLFAAYNSCDIATLGSMVSDDLEFYHDKTGLQVGKAPFLASIQKYICGKVRRDLTPGTLEVHELHGYGAVEIGSHRFHHPGIDDEQGEAKFVMVWQNSGGVWKLTRVISYDHATVPK